MPLILALLALLLTGLPLPAQQSNPFGLQPGDQIRLNGPLLLDGTTSAEVKSVGSAQFGFSIPAEPDVVYFRSFVDIDTLEARHRSRGRSAWAGALWGVYLGAAAGVISGPFIAPGTSWDTGKTIAVTGTSGAILGTLAGATIGAILAPARWYRYVVR